MSETKKSVVIACGGTGGHLFPGVAVAQELKARGHNVRLLISEKKVDAAASKKYGEDLQFDTLPAIAKPRTLSLKMIPFGIKFIKTLLDCKKILESANADAVIGMGGFTSMPPVLSGKRLGAKCFIHDSNALPGKANRLTARYCDKVFLGTEDAAPYFPNNEVVVTGTPVREEMETLPARKDAAQKLGLDPEKKTVLVMGGSQGAKKLNSIVVEASKAMPHVQFLHITGNTDFSRVEEELGEVENHTLIAFCSDMAAAYAVSDLCVCRSGASSLTELAYISLPSILVPYPFAADDHQTFNANAFAQHDAAILIQENSLDGGELVSQLSLILDDQEKLNSMRKATGDLAVRDSAERICIAIEHSLS